MAFEERSVAERQYADELTDKYEQMAVPFSIVNGKTITGFAPQELDGLLHGGPLA